MLAITTLGRLGRASQSAFAPISRLLEAEPLEVRVAAASVLASLEMEPETIRPAVTRALKDTEPKVRAAALAAIRRLGPQGSIFVPELIPLVGGKDNVERLLRRFERKGPDEGSIPALIELLKHDSAPVRLNAAKFLGLAGKNAENALPALQRLLEDPSDEVRKQAKTACEQIQGNPAAGKSQDRK